MYSFGPNRNGRYRLEPDRSEDDIKIDLRETGYEDVS
jgi:hypothetical protein